jgi:hypothetical protein
MNKLKTKYNALAQCKLERLLLSTALLAIHITLWAIPLFSGKKIITLR